MQVYLNPFLIKSRMNNAVKRQRLIIPADNKNRSDKNNIPKMINKGFEIEINVQFTSRLAW